MILALQCPGKCLRHGILLQHEGLLRINLQQKLSLPAARLTPGGHPEIGDAQALLHDKPDNGCQIERLARRQGKCHHITLHLKRRCIHTIQVCEGLLHPNTSKGSTHVANLDRNLSDFSSDG